MASNGGPSFLTFPLFSERILIFGVKASTFQREGKGQSYGPLNATKKRSNHLKLNVKMEVL